MAIHKYCTVFGKKQCILPSLNPTPTFLKLRFRTLILQQSIRNKEMFAKPIVNKRMLAELTCLNARSYRWKSWTSRSLKFDQWWLSDVECFKIILLKDLENFLILMWIIVLEMMTIIPWKLMFYEPIIHYSDNYRDSRDIVEEVVLESTNNYKNLSCGEIEWTNWQALLIVAICTIAAIALVKSWNQSIDLTNIISKNEEKLEQLSRKHVEEISELEHQMDFLTAEHEKVEKFYEGIHEQISGELDKLIIKHNKTVSDLEKYIELASNYEKNFNTLKENLIASGHWNDLTRSTLIEQQITCPMKNGENITKYLLEKIESYQSAYRAGTDLTSLTEKFRDPILPGTDEIMHHHLNKIVELGWMPGVDETAGLLSLVVDHFT